MRDRTSEVLSASNLRSEKLAALRAAIREGLDSGPAEPFNMEAILEQAHADHQRIAEQSPVK